MRDRFGRRIDYLRISVTRECNLACYYCSTGERRPEPGGRPLLSFDEIIETARAAAGLGIRKLKLTGGEPLMRPGIAKLVEKLAGVNGIDEVAMTTNGTLLSGYARELKEAGLKRINVSLDALDPGSFSKKTGGGDVTRVLEGIDAAIRSGLFPVKINCVVEKGPHEKDASDVRKYCSEKGLVPRFIRRMELGKGMFFPVLGGRGGKCGECDRIRLSCDGFIYPCLFSSLRFDVLDLGPEKAVVSAILRKPEKGTVSPLESMKTIGG